MANNSSSVDNSKMDIESDDSERWEDFFGSSTDLTPSLWGIYDKFTATLNGATPTTHFSTPQTSFNSDCDNNSDAKADVSAPATESYLCKSQKYAQREFKPHLSEADGLSQTSRSPSNSGSCNSSLKGSQESVSSANGTLNKHRNNIRVLSANVQRIITHSDAEAVDAVDIEGLQNAKKANPEHPPKLYKKSTTPTSNPHKVKFSNLPLSKVTGKLTQAGTDLVETFNTSLVEDANHCHRINAKSSSLRKPLTPAIFPIPGVDDDKTPTNPTAFSFDAPHCDRLNNNRKLSLSKNSYMKDCFTNESTLDEIVSKMSLDCEAAEEHLKETINFAVVSENLKNLTLAASSLPITGINNEPQSVVDAINIPLISKYETRSAVTRPLNYGRSKSLAAQDFAQKNINVKKTASMPRSVLFNADIEPDENQISAESLDRLTDIKSKFSPKESRKVAGLVLPDIAKLKHRPLSSSSICSTSSSSSSGSGVDSMSCKLNTSYLASVESLADHSENELTHAGMSVFERACMEIVDSERNYVNDLGGVISGYLLHWKQQACLSQDELEVLFSNIQDVYQFNQFLLKHLADSILDPLKIAKCFIELKDGFDVYTSYCTSYPEAISLLTKLLQATSTNTLLASTQRRLQHSLPLGSYLLKPVQRILKYHLLLDNLRKHCDIKEVMQAYEIMRQVARNIDQVKRKLEQQTRVKELCGILDGWLGPELTVLGELRLEGVLMENNKPRKVLLFATMLIIAKAKEDNRLQFKSYIHQNNLMLSEHLAGEPTSFYVIPYDEPRHQIKLTAKNRDQKRLWTQHIKSVILEKFDNIPLRAKELVYQLGDEEDRSTDKSPWKWGLHTTSTPTYLERRNQFRRSEMRNRSKVKRKTISNATAIDVFNESESKEANQFMKSISKSAESINDKSLVSLDSTADDSVRLRDEVCSNVKCVKSQKCTCSSSRKTNDENRENTKSSRPSHKSFRFGGKPLKERSKSVPRISLTTLEKVEQEPGKEKTPKCCEASMTNSKTLPKRMTSTLKRQKSKAKETSTFYMALSDFEDSSTVLKITESSENILNGNKEAELDSAQHNHLPDVIQKPEEFNVSRDISEILPVTPSEKIKQDAQIVLDLLKNSKDFDKLYSKIQKKRSSEKIIILSKSPETLQLREQPPRPPSRSPPPLEPEMDCLEYKSLTDNTQDEPIYETLLRNVHVPYKFSPILSRSKSVQYNKPREQMAMAPRPESDYVTLVYSAEGVLKNIDNEEVQRSPVKDHGMSTNTTASSSSSSTITLKRDSIDSENLSVRTPIDLPQQMSVSFHGTSDLHQTRSHTAKSILKRLWSYSTLTVEETSSSTPLSRSVNNLERRASDSFEKDRHSVLHLQGSETIGERMAHVDYADPRTLFSFNLREDPNELQRDSVFSLTSSNDSVSDSKPDNSTCNSKFDYEDCVEACLETDFRDSAVYSDDNERKNDKNLSLTLRISNNPPLLKPKPLNVPPSPLSNSPLKRSISVNDPTLPAASDRLPGVIMCPADLSPSSTRSWVLQQIDNFSK